MAEGFLAQVTPVVLTFNEAPNIARCLQRLRSFREVLVVDSGSTDETLTIVARHPNTRVLHRPFDSFAGQWNFALREGGISTEWALAMDADYILTNALLAELDSLSPAPAVAGYWLRFRYCIFGKELRGALYPPVVALHRHRCTSYVQDGHCMRAQVDGQIGELVHPALHDDRKPLSRWLASQGRYAAEEAELILSRPWEALRLQDRIRRLGVIAPWLVPLYCLTVKRGLLDGWPGVFYALQRGMAEGIIALKLLEHRVAASTKEKT